MRINIEIADVLMEEAIALSGAKTVEGLVTEALRLLVRMRGQAEVKNLRGKLKWHGSLDEMRTDK